MKTGIYRDEYNPRAWNVYVGGRWWLTVCPTRRRPYCIWGGARAVVTWTWYEGRLIREVLPVGRPDGSAS